MTLVTTTKKQQQRNNRNDNDTKITAVALKNMMIPNKC